MYDRTKLFAPSQPTTQLAVRSCSCPAVSRAVTVTDPPSSWRRTASWPRSNWSPGNREARSARAASRPGWYIEVESGQKQRPSGDASMCRRTSPAAFCHVYSPDGSPNWVMNSPTPADARMRPASLSNATARGIGYGSGQRSRTVTCQPCCASRMDRTWPTGPFPTIKTSLIAYPHSAWSRIWLVMLAYSAVLTRTRIFSSPLSTRV